MKTKIMRPMFALTAIFALAIAVVFGMSSFRGKQADQHMQKPPLVKAWFECIDPAHPDDPNSYRYLTGQSPTCSGSQKVCAIYADVQNNAVPDANKRPVELAMNGDGYSLEDLSIASNEFTTETDDVLFKP